MKFLVVNGPNLNMLGSREKVLYGTLTLPAIEEMITREAERLAVTVDFFQHNGEGEIVSCLHNSGEYDGIIINAGAYTHTSIAIRDALIMLGKPVVEVHLSNVYAREEFRRTSRISDIALGVIAGFRENSYLLALSALCCHLKGK